MLKLTPAQNALLKQLQKGPVVLGKHKAMRQTAYALERRGLAEVGTKTVRLVQTDGP